MLRGLFIRKNVCAVLAIMLGLAILWQARADYATHAEAKTTTSKIAKRH